MNWITEKIYGNYAVVYHRTSFDNLAEAIYTEGFKPGEGVMYGRGFYSTYELSSQDSPDMVSKYGDVVLKAAVPLHKVVILDWDVFQTTPQAKELAPYDEFNFVEKQLHRIGVRVRGSFSAELTNLAKATYTSDEALWLRKNSDLTKAADGILFTGRRDGKVLVVYNTDLVMPLAIKKSSAEKFVRTPGDQQHLSKWIKTKFAAMHKRTPRPIAFPEWFTSAYTESAEALLRNGEVEWLKGKWVAGVWEDGTWKNGIFVRGTWKNGTWLDGTWGSGTWKGGEWGSGIWEDGTWEQGVWGGGAWVAGTWKDGTWKSGIWKSGTWNDGAWQDGEWEDGTWNDGVFVSGRWRSGVWKDGQWGGNGNVSEGIPFPVWNEGIWHNGLWRGGTWEDGIWWDGTWEDGIWLSGMWDDGEWLGGIWKKGWIRDVDRKGNLQPDWPRSAEGYTLSPINPTDYWKGKK